MSRAYRRLAWSDPHGLIARGAQSFLYFAHIVDTAGFEYRYIGKSAGRRPRLADYRRNVDRIFKGQPRRTTQGQEKYRAVHLAMAKACEYGWEYEFYALEEVSPDRIDDVEQRRIVELACNLNNSSSWAVEEYDSLMVRDLLR